MKHIDRPRLRLALLLWLCPNVLAQPAPHHIRDLTVAPHAPVTLSLDGGVSNLFNLTGANLSQFRNLFDLYVVEASTDLRDWTRLALLSRVNSDSEPLMFEDTSAPAHGYRFYRTPTNHLVTAFAEPSGPFAVGTLTRILTDAPRSNRYGLRTNSSFMVSIWYPAEPAGAGCLPERYSDEAVAGDRSLYSFWGWSLQWANVMPRCVTHAFTGVPSAAGTNRFPVILHSHGWTCDRRFNSQRAAELASHGYVVAAPDHEDCHATVYPDERGARYVSPGSRTDFAALVRSRTNDFLCLLQGLWQMQSTDPVLAGRLELDRIGVMGFSLGGGTAAELARVDPRVRCAALLDPWIESQYFPGLSAAGLRKPFLSLNHTINDHGFGDFGPYTQRLFDLAVTDAIWSGIAQSGHFAFSDFAWAVEQSADSRRGSVAINALVNWFFDKHLKDDARPLPQLAEIVALKSK